MPLCLCRRHFANGICNIRKTIQSTCFSNNSLVVTLKMVVTNMLSRHLVDTLCLSGAQANVGGLGLGLRIGLAIRFKDYHIRTPH